MSRALATDPLRVVRRQIDRFRKDCVRSGRQALDRADTSVLQDATRLAGVGRACEWLMGALGGFSVVGWLWHGVGFGGGRVAVVLWWLGCGRGV